MIGKVNFKNKPPFQVGDKVYMKIGRGWILGKIKRFDAETSKYVIELPNGEWFVRSARSLRAYDETLG